MTFYIYSNGDLADADQVNANFNETIYAILYNRMEQDTNATVYRNWCADTCLFTTLIYCQPQINTHIQSDSFGDTRYSTACYVCATVGVSAGKYSTVCAANTTSTFENGKYIGATYCRWSLPYTTCCVYTENCGFATLCYACNRIHSCTSACKTCIGCVCDGYACVNQVFAADYGAIADYHRVRLCSNNTVMLVCPSGISLICFNLNGISCCISRNTTYGCITCNYDVDIIRLTPNCYELFYNNASVCCVPGNTIVCLQAQVMACSCGQNCNYSNLSWTKVDNLLFFTSKIESSVITTNIKEYTATKSNVMLSTVSTLPAGNCIRYNIKDQAGTVLLCDASPDAVYSLSSPANCLYAEIYQCVECNLCTPQCMTQYALMYM